MPSLIAILGLKGDEFESGLKTAQFHAQRAGKQIGGALRSEISNALAGAGGALAAGSLINGAMQIGERIHILSEEFRVSTDEVQKWDEAAKRVGMTAEDVGGALNRLKKSRAEAVEKNDVGGFGAFGVGMDQLKNQALSTEQLMDRIRAAAAGHPITDQEDVAGMELMGKSGAKILSVMQSLHELGPISLIDKKSVDDLEKARIDLEATKRDAEVGIAEGLAWAGDKLRLFGAALAGIYGQLRGEKTKDAFSEFEKMARPNQAKEAGSTEHYAAVATVNLHKDDAAIEQLRLQLAERILEAHLKSLSPIARQVEFKKEIAEHERKAMEFRFGEGDEKKALQEDLKAQALRDQVAGAAGHASRGLDLNASQKIGAYAAMPPGFAEIQGHIREIARAVNRTAENTTPRPQRSMGVNFGDH